MSAGSAHHVVGQLHNVVPVVQVELSGPGVCVMAEGLQICRRGHRSHSGAFCGAEGPGVPTVRRGMWALPPPGEASFTRKLPQCLGRQASVAPGVQRLHSLTVL